MKSYGKLADNLPDALEQLAQVAHDFSEAWLAVAPSLVDDYREAARARTEAFDHALVVSGQLYATALNVHARSYDPIT